MARPSLDSFVETKKPSLDTFSQPKVTQPKSQSLSDTIWGGIANAGNFIADTIGGKQVGQFIGDKIAQTIDPQRYEQLKKERPDLISTGAQAAGDVAQFGLTLAAPFSGGSSLGSKLAINTALGAGIGGAHAIAEGATSGGDIGANALLGGGLGAAGTLAAEGISYASKNLPTWLTKKALPKLDAKNIPHALENTKLGSIETLTKDSNNAVRSYANQVNSVLQHPQYVNELGDGSLSLQGVMENFPDAKLTPNKVTSVIRKVVPGSEKLVDKLATGTANLFEKNQLRQALDLATKKVFTDTPDVTFNKQIAHALADSLRNEIKSIAPETEPIFESFTKELNLNKALQTASKKLAGKATVGLYDILSAIGGFTAGGPLGALGGYATEKALRSPAVELGAAKLFQGAGKSAPVVGAIGKGLKAPIIKAATARK